MKSVRQIVLIASFLPFCWLAMMAVHELGHILAALISGGMVTQVVVHPLAISRTDVEPNPHPLIVVWGGPLFGVAAPLLIWAATAAGHLYLAFLSRFFAGFCLIANGAYLGVGSLVRVGDAGVMLRLGTPLWLLSLFGLLAVPLGLLLWHRQGPSFGFGESRGLVEPSATYLSLVLLLTTLILELAFSPQT
jgi:hypothetical protein